MSFIQFIYNKPKVNINSWENSVTMKKIFITFLVFCSLFFLSPVQASFFDDFINDSRPEAFLCDEWECGLQAGIELARQGINDVETDRSLSQYIQDIVIFLLTFISIVAVLYIIYAGFNIIVWNGDEEKLKKSKGTIIYVLIGLVLIWLAWPITFFIIDILNIS